MQLWFGMKTEGSPVCGFSGVSRDRLVEDKTKFHADVHQKPHG